MLLEGSYLNDVEIIMEKVKLVRRNMISRGFLKVGISLCFVNMKIKQLNLINILFRSHTNAEYNSF